MRARRTVAVYVDGFALYKALLQYRYPQHKWLDLAALCARLFPRRDVVKVALRTTEVEIVEGNFSFVKQYLPIHPEEVGDNGKVVTVRVKRPEEKGSDVALASHLILDAIDDVADSYAIITNDSDLAPPVGMLCARGYRVALVSVAGPHYNKAFEATGIETVRQIREGTLRASQFGRRLIDAEGRTIAKPASWP